MKLLIKFRATTPRFFVLFAIGGLALSSKVSASGGPPSNCNTSEGYQALFNVTTGVDDTAFGGRALFNDTTGSDNTAIGCGALVASTIGIDNTAIGSQALSRNINGSGNTANGYQALYNNTDGGANTAVGYQALFNNTGRFSQGSTAIGFSALSNANSANNTALGAFAGVNVTTAQNVIVIGAGVPGTDVSNSCFIGNIRGTMTANDDAIPVVIDSAGQLGTTSSSARFKTDIKPMDKSSESILALKPVTFRHKNSNTCTPQFGLIAEDVAKVNPDLVVRDADGKIYTVRYDVVNAMLLNEFLKAHKTIEEQQATITQLMQEMDTVVARLNEQDSKNQKVSMQLEMLGPAAKWSWITDEAASSTTAFAQAPAGTEGARGFRTSVDAPR